MTNRTIARTPCIYNTQSRNGSCTSPTSAGGNYRGSRAGIEGAPGVSSRSSNFHSSDSSSGGGGNAGTGGGAGGVGSSGASTAGPTGRTRPECVRRSKSQGTGSHHHRYRDRLVRTLAFNSSCPANAKEEDSAAVASSNYQGGAPPLHGGHSGYDSVDHGHNNGKLLDHGSRDEPTQQQPAARRSLLLLHHRHQSAYTSFGINVTWHTTHQNIIIIYLYIHISLLNSFILYIHIIIYWFIFFSSYIKAKHI